jgi:hypothetical protein
MFANTFRVTAAAVAVSAFGSPATAQYLPSPPGIPVRPYTFFAGQAVAANMGQVYNVGFYRTTPFGNPYTYLPASTYGPYYANRARAMKAARKQFAEPEAKQDHKDAAPAANPRTVEIRADRNGVANFEGLPTAFKTAVLNPTDATIQSGAALNDILSTVVDLGKRGVQAPGPYLAPELMTTLRFSGNANGDLANWARAGEIEFPPPFQSKDYATPRSWLKHDFAVAAQALTAGKTPDSAIAQGLATAGKTIRRTFDAAKATMPPAEVKAAEQFLARFDAAVGVVRAPATAGLVVADWPTVGTGVAELAEHMARYQLHFGPCPAGQDAAYKSLHQAFAAYATAMTENRR